MVIRHFSLARLLWLLLFLILSACSSQNEVSPNHSIEIIFGRSFKEPLRQAVYDITIPSFWKREAEGDDPVSDTMKPLAKWTFEELCFTIYNFPFEQNETRIAPALQIERWKKQLHVLPESTLIEPQAFSGYKGLYFEGIGKMDQTPYVIMAWSLQLGDGHAFNLRKLKNRSPNDLTTNLLSDITLKVTGPKELMEAYKEEIISMARSFETINPFP